MNEPASPAPLSTGIFALAPLRLLVYYGLVLAALQAAIDLVPGLAQAMEAERTRHIISISETLSPGEGASHHLLAPGNLTAVVTLSLAVAVLLSFPVSWVYGWTARRKIYSQTFSQSLVVLPLVIATVVFLVKGSLALAFSLAGIVAAVRFRHRLTETRDAIFVFMSIGIGLAAGVQLLMPAFVASAAFNLTVVALHSRNYGSRPARLDGLTLQPRQAKPAQAALAGPAVELAPGLPSVARTEPARPTPDGGGDLTEGAVPPYLQSPPPRNA